MDINEFRAVLTTFADDASDIDMRNGRVVAHIREDIIDVSIAYSKDEYRHLLIVENDQETPARTWLINRVAKLPQLADRIISVASSTADLSAKSPFVIPSGYLTDDLADSGPAQDRKVPDAVATLLEKSSIGIPGTTSILYLTSDAGEGKTTVIGRAAKTQAELFKQKRTSSLLVPIPLSGRTFLTFDDAVIAALVNKLRFNYFYFDAFLALVKLGVLVPAFDGYEEMLVEGTKGEAVSALGNLIQSLDSSGSIVIAARKAFFEYLSFKTQARLIDAIGSRAASFSKLELSRWNKDQFCKYGDLRLASDPSEIYQIVSGRLGTDHPLLTRAVLVRRLFDVVETIPTAHDLAEKLGKDPHDYFFTFVDAIIVREARDKWLARVTGEVSEPLLTVDEHHLLLALIAQEMWESSSSALRFDVLNAVVELFCDGRKKSPAVVRQIIERTKQHSLLIADTSRSQSVAFDHEDFQSFYLGESLGRLLGSANTIELQTFLSINLIPGATVEQAVQHLIRREFAIEPALKALLSINASEVGFTFCKENCSALVIRLAECRADDGNQLSLSKLLLSAHSLAGRRLGFVSFENCHFQPTAVTGSSFQSLTFSDCEFERLEAVGSNSLQGCRFSDCRIDSLLIDEEGSLEFDPARISRLILDRGAQIGSETQLILIESADDANLKCFERFLRLFLRNTHVDENVIRVRMGKGSVNLFFDEILPVLTSQQILEEIPWRGKGVQRRWKLVRSLSDIHDALQRSGGTFGGFLDRYRELK